MINNYKKNWKIYHIIFMVITLLVSIPNVFATKIVGLDESFQYALNKLFNEGYIAGKDYIFTYGALGFLMCCMKEGKNVLIALIFWAIILGTYGIFLYQLLFEQKKENRNIFTLIGLFMFMICGLSPEYYLAYIGLLGILLAMNGHKRDIYAFCFLLALSLHIKFSLFILMVMIMVVYLAFGYFQDKELYKYCVPRICFAVILMPCIYFAIYGVSLTNFKNYVKGSIEVSSGYNVAMSLSIYDMYVIWIMIAAIAYAVCLIMSAKSGMYNFMVLSFVSVCLFMLYKHGFVRADGHVINAMRIMLIFLSLVVIFLDWNDLWDKLGQRKSIFLSMFMLVVFIAVIQDGLASVNIIATIKNKAFNFPLRIGQMMEQEDEELNPLPSDIMETIGDATVSIYPWEISYCVSNDLNYVPFMTLQAYDAYTPYLDRISAEKFLGENAPEYIIFQMNAIDGRWAFIECPQTWEAIRNRYFVAMQEGDIFLLQHKDKAPAVVYESLGSITRYKEDKIELINADYIKINAELNWKGKLAKLFWKIPKVKMTVYYTGGDTKGVNGRVLLDLFSEGVEVGSIVCHGNTAQLTDMINEQGIMSKVDAIRLSGDGLFYYKNDMSIEFFHTRSEEEKVSADSVYAREWTDEDFSSYSIEENGMQFTIDSINGNGLYTKIYGWAFLEGLEADRGQICVEHEGKYYICNEISRPDVEEYFGLSSDMVGYDVLLKVGDVEGNICIIDTENKVIYK